MALAKTWDPSFFRKSPLFWPIAPAARALETFAAWPAPADLDRLGAPVRFERAAPKPRRGKPTPGPGYDARIALEGIVPTRAQSWHDLLNALVWATFPRAKLALHARQHRMIAARLGDEQRLPSARTKEQDAVAMLDEGGVVVLRDETASCAVIFGHAIYEGLVCGGPPNVRGAGLVVAQRRVPSTPEQKLAAADAALAALLAREEPIGREGFETVVVSEELAPG